MNDDVARLRGSAHPLKSYWLEHAESILRKPLVGADCEGLDYLRRNRGDPSSDCSEWVGQKFENFYSGVDIATRVRNRIVYDLASRLSLGEYRAFASVMLPDARVEHREIPPDAFSGSTFTSGVCREPGDPVDLFTSGKLNAFGILYFDIRVVSASDVSAQPSRRARGGRPRKRDALESACKIALDCNPAFCGLTVEEAKKLVEPILKTTLKNPPGFEGGIHSETFRRAKNAVCGSAKSSK